MFFFKTSKIGLKFNQVTWKSIKDIDSRVATTVPGMVTIKQMVHKILSGLHFS